MVSIVSSAPVSHFLSLLCSELPQHMSVCVVPSCYHPPKLDCTRDVCVAMIHDSHGVVFDTAYFHVTRSVPGDFHATHSVPGDLLMQCVYLCDVVVYIYVML